MTKEELEMRVLVRESDVIDRTTGSELAKAFNHLWDKYIESETIIDKMKSEIEQTCSWHCFDEWGNKTDAWKAIENVIDKYTGGKPE